MGFPLVMVVMGIVLFVPGLVVLRACGVRGLVALAVSPAITAAVVALGAALANAAGLRWNMLTLGLATLVPVLLLVAATGPAHFSRPCVPARQPWRSRVVTGAVALVCALLLVGPKLFGVDLSRPAQAVDSTFHQNAIWLTARTGNASYFGSLSCMYGLECPSTRYPNALHGIVAPVAQMSDAVPAANALTVVIPVIWVLGMMALAGVAAPRFPLAAPVAGVLTTFVHAFPLGLVDLLPVWPNALAVAMLPGVCALAITSLGAVRAQAGPRSTRWLLASSALVSAGGTCLVHPSSFFALAAVAFPGGVLLAVWSWGRARRRWGTRQANSILGLGALTIALPVTLIVKSPVSQRMLDRPVLGDLQWPGLKLSYFFTLWLHRPLDMGTNLVALTLTVLALVGALVAVRIRHMWWLVGAWVTTGLLLESSMFPIPLVSRLTGLWYSSPERLTPVHAVPVVTIAAAGGAFLLEWARRRLGAIGTSTLMLGPLVAALVLSSLVLGPLRLEAARRIHEPEPGSLTFSADTDELEMIRTARSMLGSDAYVLGDPANGSALLQAYGDVRVVFPHVTLPKASLDSMYMVQHFRELESDAEVCRIVNEYGITHFYEDQDGLYAGSDMAVRARGLYGVDTSQGFSLVAHGGTAKIWKIDTCAVP